MSCKVGVLRFEGLLRFAGEAALVSSDPDGHIDNEEMDFVSVKIRMSRGARLRIMEEIRFCEDSERSSKVVDVR